MKFEIVKLSKRIPALLILIYILIVLVLSIAVINFSKQFTLDQTYVLGIRADYWLHLLMFLPWMAIIRLLRKSNRMKGYFPLALASGLLLGLISEGVQLVLPYRAFNPIDLLANGCGVLVGGMLTGLMWKLKQA